MIRKLLHRAIDRVETRLGVPLDESRFVLDRSLGSFLAFSTVQTWTDRREHLPATIYYVAKIAAYREEDCGTCLQIAVNLARKAGVAAEIVRAAAHGRVESLTPELQDVYRFASQQANRVDDVELREKLRARYGDAALIELALGIAAARMFPTFKRTLGFAISCSKVDLAA